jgi:hypothetical protein
LIKLKNICNFHFLIKREIIKSFNEGKPSYLSKSSYSKLENWKSDLNELKMNIVIDICSHEQDKTWSSDILNLSEENNK